MQGSVAVGSGELSGGMVRHHASILHPTTDRDHRTMGHGIGLINILRHAFVSTHIASKHAMPPHLAE